MSEPIDRDDLVIEVPLKKGMNGPIVGSAILKPTEANGIYLITLRIDGEETVGTGIGHFPIKEGDKINTAWTKED
jgi:hypothetical protein